jgi:phage terminase large subunit
MSDQKRVKIRYRPRDQFRPFHSRKQRWSVLVCHRRAGKTVATLNDLIRGAVNECKPEGRYAFIFPQRNQARILLGVTCVGMRSRYWPSRRTNLSCVPISSMGL